MTRKFDWRALEVCARGCACAETPPAQIPHDMVIFAYFFRLGWRGVRFPRAQPRVCTSSAQQLIFLIMQMVLHTLIAIVTLVAVEINGSEFTKKVDTFPPPPPCSECIANNTGR